MPARDEKRLLTPRQFACLQGVADHLDSGQIAARLGISEHTVNGHLQVAMQQLGAPSRREAVRRYLSLQQEHPEKVTGQFLRLPVDPPAGQSEPQLVTLNEEPAPRFEWEQALSTPADGSRTNDINIPLKTLALVIGAAAGLVVLALAIDPLTQSAMRLANAIQSYHIRH